MHWYEGALAASASSALACAGRSRRWPTGALPTRKRRQKPCRRCGSSFCVSVKTYSSAVCSYAYGARSKWSMSGKQKESTSRGSRAGSLCGRQSTKRGLAASGMYLRVWL